MSHTKVYIYIRENVIKTVAIRDRILNLKADPKNLLHSIYSVIYTGEISVINCDILKDL